MPDFDLETTVRRLAAIEDIKRLKYRYWRMIDGFVPGQVESLFTTDAVLDAGANGQHVGRDVIAAHFEHQLFPAYQMAIHHGVNPEIEVADDFQSATGRWCFNAWMLSTGAEPLGFWHVGYYEDKYAIEDGEWRVAYTRGKYFFNVGVRDQWVSERFSPLHPPPSYKRSPTSDEQH
ncbi:MAG: nuclear transport factor 2 family protein [Ilumatobacteraceae bacterium]